jgi:hypothetical protein
MPQSLFKCQLKSTIEQANLIERKPLTVCKDTILAFVGYPIAFDSDTNLDSFFDSVKGFISAMNALCKPFCQFNNDNFHLSIPFTEGPREKALDKSDQRTLSRAFVRPVHLAFSMASGASPRMARQSALK